MKLKGFQVYMYRNIIDSGWVDICNVTALVGQNECGKSNLLQALLHINPFDNSEYQIDSDWPIDYWATKNKSQVVCKAKFILSEEETKDFFASSKLSDINNDPSIQVGVDEIQKTRRKKQKIDDRLVSTIEIIVEKNYLNNLDVNLVDMDSVYIDIKKAKAWIVTHLPKCVYMADYSTFAGHAELDNLIQRLTQHGRENLSEEDKTILITLDLAAINSQDLVAKGLSEGGRTIRAFDTSAASRHLTQQFKHQWKQKDIKFNIRIDGPTLDILVEDVGLEAFVPLERRSRGLQWFVSFIWRFTHASKGEFANCVLLLDEPGIHLHHAGHIDLLEFFEQLSHTNIVLYTTHLSTMLDGSYPERIKIMEVIEHHAVVSNSMVSSQREPMMIIESRLGLSGNMSGLLGSRQNLVVEGVDEVIILNKLSGLLQASGEAGLSDRIYIIPADGASKTPFFAGFLIGNKWDAGVLLDSDEAGEEARKKIKKQFLGDLARETGSKFRILMLGEIIKSTQNETAIEDLFPPEFYLKCINEAYGTNITEDDLPKDGSTELSKRAETVLKLRGRTGELEKYRVMRAMQKRFDNFKTLSDLPEGTSEKARILINKINEVFASQND